MSRMGKRTTYGRQKSNRALKKILNRVYYMAGLPIACHWCDMPMEYRHATVDHLVPRWNGGRHHPSNVVFACKRCNTLRDGLDRADAGLGNEPKPKGTTKPRLLARLKELRCASTK